MVFSAVLWVDKVVTGQRLGSMVLEEFSHLKDSGILFCDWVSVGVGWYPPQTTKFAALAVCTEQGEEQSDPE